jgi:hypothetical protein
VGEIAVTDAPLASRVTTIARREDVVTIIDFMARSAGRTLDRRVQGASGHADGRYEELVDEADLLARASTSGTGHLVLEVLDKDGQLVRREEGEDALQVNLGRGERLRAGVLTVDGVLLGDAAGRKLAGLVLELSQSQAASGPQTFSVEGRFDAAGQAHLRLVITLGDDDEEPAAAVAGQ